MEGLRVRIGLHAGEAICDQGDFFGRSVIVAARIAGQARGGEIRVSSAARQRARGCGVSFDCGRHLRPKGLVGTHRVFNIVWQGAAATA